MAMNYEPLASLKSLEADLWEAADQLRANSKLTSNDYCMPVLGVIFLRHAANRFAVARKQIEDDQAAGRMPKRKVVKADYIRRRALWLPEVSRYDYIAELPTDRDLGQTLNDAMKAIEDDFEPLKGVLPKEYSIFDRSVLEDLVRIFNREALRTAGGDLFGRIYEYFLMKFAMQKAMDNGEFFTPPSIVQTIVNVIEPEHGIVFDPACGSGGMFVQSSHFIERLGQDTSQRVVFYGQEKTATTIKLAKMNLAVHGLEGHIVEANTYYEDAHTLVGKCNFVMANPPFNVDMVDAEKIEGDKRLPFGLPGVNKAKKVSNGNYLWISYFHSYLGDSGRAGFVMSSQASSAGHGEKEVRRKIVQTGHVDVMVAIRPGFFYTRTVPCELWFFDTGKPAERRDTVLMLDARNVHRKMTRTIYDFSPEQMANLSAIVWLYRGQKDRFLGLVKDYFDAVCRECDAIPPSLDAFDSALAAARDPLSAFAKAAGETKDLDQAAANAFAAAMGELAAAADAYTKDRATLASEVVAYRKAYCRSLPASNDKQHDARKAFDPIAERARSLSKQVELLHKFTVRAADAAVALAGDQRLAEHHDRRAVARLLKALDAGRQTATEQLRLAVYFHRQIAWLHERFPDAQLQAVPGLCKLATLAVIEAADWSLTPGRYVGVAPPEQDDDSDFEQALRDIHVELADLNEEAVELAKRISNDFEELIA
jgi:type I restriction enzyme M protein